MKLNTTNEILAENKVLILYILDKIGKPTTDNELLKIVISITDMNYFYFQQFITDLIESKYIIKYNKDNFNFIEITLEGKRTLELTSNIIPGITKLKIDSNLKPLQKEIKEELSIIADFEPKDSNNFFVNCKIIENNNIVFNIGILANSRETAKNICENWKKNANKLFPEFIKLMHK